MTEYQDSFLTEYNEIKNQALPNLNHPPLEKVFLALKTNIFGVEDEHITLKYFEKASLGRIAYVADDLCPYVPTEITIDGFANYRSGQMFYEVAMVNRFNNPNLFAQTTFPHISLRASTGPLSCATFEPAIYGSVHEIVDRIYLAKKVKGKLRWLELNNKDSIPSIRTQWNELMKNV